MKPGHYYDQCWMQNFYFFIGWTEDQYTSYMKKNYGFQIEPLKGFEGRASELIHDDGRMIILVWTRNKKKTAEGISYIAHECVHAANMCLELVGHKPDQRNDEVLAYLVTVLIKKAIESCK